MGFHKVNGYWECDRCGTHCLGTREKSLPQFWSAIEIETHPDQVVTGQNAVKIWRDTSYGTLHGFRRIPSVVCLCEHCTRKVTKPLWKILNW